MEDSVDKPDDPLAQCEEVVEQLKEENAQLRASAQTFADLAERLNDKKRPGKSGQLSKPNDGT